jgi:hypothetical protein
LKNAVSRQLDTTLFSNSAATSQAPAGLAAGITPLTAVNADLPGSCRGDVRNLADAIATGGGGPDPLYFCSPGRKTSLLSYCPNLDGRVFASSVISTTQLFSVDPQSFASATGGDPEILASKEALLHYEDIAPLPISSVGTPNTIAAPVRSAFQTDVILLRCILRITWTMRVPGGISWISTGLTW